MADSLAGRTGPLAEGCYLWIPQWHFQDSSST